MLRAIFAPMLVLLLASCTSATFNDQKQLSLVAPDVIQYTREKQEAAAKEVEAGSCPILTDFGQDYCVMRDQARILRGEKPICTIKWSTERGMKVWLNQADFSQPMVDR